VCPQAYLLAADYPQIDDQCARFGLAYANFRHDSFEEIGPKKIGPKRIDPKRIDPKRIDPKRIDTEEGSTTPSQPAATGGGAESAQDPSAR
jgi:hypothetical protein